MSGIPGDGRCLFRSVAHGAYLRAGKPSPSESLQKELADELREKVAEEFVRRRADTEWFLEGDFNEYVTQMRKPHVWGGEPELLMCSHVLKMPITVYMHTDSSDNLKIISEYGQEYGKDNPIRVLYHGYGHYDALQVPLARMPSKFLSDLRTSTGLRYTLMMLKIYRVCKVMHKECVGLLSEIRSHALVWTGPGQGGSSSSLLDFGILLALLKVLFGFLSMIPLDG